MHELPTILTERIDDIPLLLEPRQRRGLPTLFDTHFPTHGTGTGLSLGWVSPLWLRAIVSRGAHRRGHVAPWVATRLWTLGVTPGQAVTRVDLTDARRALVRRRLRHAERGGAFASALHPHTGRGHQPLAQREEGEGPSAQAAGVESVGGGARLLGGVVREGPQGAREWRAEGSASPVALRQPVGEPVPHGPARRVVGRSGRPAHAAAVALRARVAQALAQIEALQPARARQKAG